MHDVDTCYRALSARDARFDGLFFVGVATTGGRFPPAWRELLKSCIANGLGVESGLHEFVSEDAELAELASSAGVTLRDLRKPPEGLSVPTGANLDVDAAIVLTVGSDCAIGKKTVAVELDLEARRQGLASVFVPTGQTGIATTSLGSSCAISSAVFVAFIEPPTGTHATSTDPMSPSSCSVSRAPMSPRWMVCRPSSSTTNAVPLPLTSPFSPSRYVRTATRTATEIFARAGVSLTLVECREGSGARPGECDAPLNGGEVAVRLIRSTAAHDARSLGMSYVTHDPRHVRLAAVFVDRVDAAATRNGTRRGALLGRTIAHELGHLLLGSAHSATGLMRPQWSDRDLRENYARDYWFAPGQASVLVRRVAETSGLGQVAFAIQP